MIPETQVTLEGSGPSASSCPFVDEQASAFGGKTELDLRNADLNGTELFLAAVCEVKKQIG